MRGSGGELTPSHDPARSTPAAIPRVTRALRSVHPLGSISAVAALNAIGLQIATDGIGIPRSTWPGGIVLLGAVALLLLVAPRWRGARRRRAGCVGTHEKTRR